LHDRLAAHRNGAALLAADVDLNNVANIVGVDPDRASLTP